MSVLRLVLCEILYRKVGFALAVAGVAVATACLVAELSLLDRHDRQTDQLVADKEARTQQRMAKLQDDYRKITRQLGFNVLILPRDQSLSDLYADDFAARTMPEEYAQRLARAQVVTIQHVLPSLQQKVKWPERQRTVIVTGVRGEVPIMSADEKKPILEPVPAGSVVVGSELHRQLGLKVGDTLPLLGRAFTVGKLQEERGTRDDITLWINLREAQELFDKKGLINGILALECVCAADSLPKVRAEIGRILPDTQVIEFASQTLTRAEARQRAATEARQAVEQEKLARADLRRQREALASVIVPVALLGAAVWVALLALGNVRERRGEIGVWRALGLRGRQILGLFLARAVLAGAVGGVVGFALGTAVAVGRFDVRWLVLALVAAPLLAGLAAWVPALWAARQDPAAILGEG